MGIIDDLARDDWLRESSEFSAVPDELAFQTLYANRLALTARSYTGPMLTDMPRQAPVRVSRVRGAARDSAGPALRAQSRRRGGGSLVPLCTGGIECVPSLARPGGKSASGGRRQGVRRG